MSFRNAPCWTEPDAAAMLRTEALEPSRAVFMAVHSPIRDFGVDGMLAGAVPERTEHGLLQALTGPDHRHLFCVVEGEPGSGKSHLIRWLWHQWDKERPRDLVLMVPRSNGSLEGALRHMQERLPARFRASLAGLGQARDTSLRGRARDFHSKLANSLSPGYFASEAPAHAEWAEKYQIGPLIGHPHVLGQWSAPMRILTTLSGGDDRNSRTEQLTLADIVELVGYLRPLRDRTLSQFALMAKRKLELEEERLRPLMKQRPNDEALKEVAADVAPETIRLLEALSARFNPVVQDLIGIGRDGLVRAFRQLRRQIASERGQRAGKDRLVLLLEDVTSFQGVDNQLLDVLVSKSEVEEEAGLCDLISVVGITTDFFNKAMKSYGNLRDRIALHLRLGEAGAGRVEDNLSLASSHGRQAFVGTYLRAIRAGKEALERWEKASEGAVPNLCEGCPHRSICHPAFGATEQGIGFFPLSPTAIDRVFDSLTDPQGTMSLRTPRGMVQNVISPLLLHPERLRNGQFPPGNLEGVYLPQAKRSLTPATMGVLESRIVDGEERERMRRFIAWWSSSGTARTEQDSVGNLCFAGIPQAAYEAFGLPWLGEDSDSARPPSSEGTARSSRPPNESGAKPPPREEPSKPRPTPPRSREVDPPGQRTKVSPGTIGARRAELTLWQEGGNVQDDSLWSKLSMEILDTLPWAAMGVPCWLQQKLFTENTVALEGTRKASVRHFILPRERWVRDGLDAWLALRDRSEDDREHSRRRFARFLRRLIRLVQRHVEARSLRTASGDRWHPAGAAAQALLVGAWLTGRFDVRSSLATQWEAILTPDTKGFEVAENHTSDWKELVQRIGHYREPFRQMLREWIRLSPGTGGDDRGVVDAGAIASALVALATRMEPDLPPAISGLPEQVKIWESIADIGRLMYKALPRLPHDGLSQVKRHVERIDQACDGRSLPQYLEEVGQAIADLHKQDPRAPHAMVQDWTRARKVLDAAGLLDARLGSRLQRLEDFLGGADPETLDRLQRASASDQLAWVIEAPSRDLALIAQQIEAAERALEELWKHVSSLLAEAGGEASDAPDKLRGVAVRLRHAVDLLDKAIAEEGT